MTLDEFRKKVVKTMGGLEGGFNFKEYTHEIYNSMNKDEKKEFYSENYKKGDAVLAEKNGSLKFALLQKIKDEMFDKK